MPQKVYLLQLITAQTRQKTYGLATTGCRRSHGVWGFETRPELAFRATRGICAKPTRNFWVGLTHPHVTREVELFARFASPSHPSPHPFTFSFSTQHRAMLSTLDRNRQAGYLKRCSSSSASSMSSRQKRSISKWCIVTNKPSILISVLSS